MMYLGPERVKTVHLSKSILSGLFFYLALLIFFFFCTHFCLGVGALGGIKSRVRIRLASDLI